MTWYERMQAMLAGSFWIPKAFPALADALVTAVVSFNRWLRLGGSNHTAGFGLGALPAEFF